MDPPGEVAYSWCTTSAGHLTPGQAEKSPPNTTNRVIEMLRAPADWITVARRRGSDPLLTDVSDSLMCAEGPQHGPTVGDALAALTTVRTLFAGCHGPTPATAIMITSGEGNGGRVTGGGAWPVMAGTTSQI